jgi:hypothetical protein
VPYQAIHCHQHRLLHAVGDHLQGSNNNIVRAHPTRLRHLDHDGAHLAHKLRACHYQIYGGTELVKEVTLQGRCQPWLTARKAVGQGLKDPRNDTNQRRKTIPVRVRSTHKAKPERVQGHFPSALVYIVMSDTASETGDHGESSESRPMLRHASSNPDAGENSGSGTPSSLDDSRDSSGPRPYNLRSLLSRFSSTEGEPSTRLGRSLQRLQLSITSERGRPEGEEQSQVHRLLQNITSLQPAPSSSQHPPADLPPPSGREAVLDSVGGDAADVAAAAERHRLTTTSTVDIRAAAQSAEKALPFVSLLLLVFIYQHFTVSTVEGR